MIFLLISDYKMMTWYTVFFVLITIVSLANQIPAQQLKSLKILSEWKEMEFEFPTRDIRENAILNNVFIPGNAVPIDIDVDYRGCSLLLTTFTQTLIKKIYFHLKLKENHGCL